MNRLAIVATATLVVLGAMRDGWSQGNDAPAPVLVFNLVAPTDTTANRVFFLPSFPAKGDNPQEALAKALKTNKVTAVEINTLDQLASTNRWTSGKKDDILTVYVIYGSKPACVTVTFDEQDRQTQLATDVSSLAKALLEGEAGKTVPSYNVETRTYKLVKMRATLVVQASLADSCTTPGAVPTNAQGSQPATPLQAKLMTGPMEHLFLAGDLPLNSASQLKYDQSSNSLQPTETPKEFMISVNYLIGDLIADKPGWGWERLTLKALVKFAKQPLDSYGFALGYRFPPATKAGGIDLDGISVFGGYIWTKEDAIQAGQPQTNAHYTGAWRIGVSFNLDTALKWAKGS